MKVPAEELRAYLESSPIKAVLLEGIIPEELAAELRERVRPLLRPHYVADRGRYQLDETLAVPELFTGLIELAGAVLAARVVPARARWTRFAHGDYAMYRDDRIAWKGLERHAEVVLDFSATATSEGQVVYNDGQHVFWMPQVPLCGALVDRRHKMQRYDRYVTHRAGEAELFRLSLALEVG